MRFDSIEGLLHLLLVFNSLGYLSHSLNFKDDMKKAGMTMHISHYTASITCNFHDDTISISFCYYGNILYTIVLDRVYDKK